MKIPLCRGISRMIMSVFKGTFFPFIYLRCGVKVFRCLRVDIKVSGALRSQPIEYCDRRCQLNTISKGGKTLTSETCCSFSFPFLSFCMGERGQNGRDLIVGENTGDTELCSIRMSGSFSNIYIFCIQDVV